MRMPPLIEAAVEAAAQRPDGDSAACACRPSLKQPLLERVQLVVEHSAACACRPSLKRNIEAPNRSRTLEFGGMRMPPLIEAG